MLKKLQKKGIMGIGMLLIFIATVVISGMAAGVLITATGVLQQRALSVEQSTRNRLVSGVEVFSVFTNGNTTSETITEFEFHTWLRPGSLPIQFRNMGFAFITQNLSLGPNLNESLIGENCTFENLTAEDEYCLEPRIGDLNTVLEEGEITVIKFKLNSSHALGTEEDISVIFQPKSGSKEMLDLRTPEIVLTSKIKLW
jgi:archaellin